MARLQIELNLETATDAAPAAQQCLTRMSQGEWELLVAFALRVVCLAEEVDREYQFLVDSAAGRPVAAARIPTDRFRKTRLALRPKGR